MRALWLGFALTWAACPLPEDGFVLSGTVSGARPDVEVRLLRNRFASETRCDALEPLAVTRTDAFGAWRFELIRQQVTAGVEGRRFFAVEAARATSGLDVQRFWFPDADLELGELGVGVSAGTVLTDLQLDGHVAWRGLLHGEPELDRRAALRVVQQQRRWVTVPVDSLGRTDTVPVEARVEGPTVEVLPVTLPPPGRGAKCPFIDVEPCPLTDGRFVPYVFPPDTPALVFNFGRETSVKNLLFHGLVLERPASKVRYDFNFFVDYEQWNPMVPASLEPGLFERAAEACDEPGAFFSTSAVGVASPVIFRVRFEDADGRTVPIVSLQELSVL